MKCALIFIIAVSAACASAQQSNVVYPLGVGDKWEYWLTWGAFHDHTVVLGDTIMSDGLHYAHIFEDSHLTSRFERQSGDSVFEYPSSLKYVFSNSVGDTIWTRSAPAETTDCILVLADTTSIFGRELRRWRFWMYRRNAYDAEQSYDIVDSLGMAEQRAAMTSTIALTGAIIDGIQYGSITDVRSDRSNLPDKSFSLPQNFPNPFNLSTIIRYTLPSHSHVALTVFNILGAQVAGLVDGVQPAGSYDVRFDASTLPGGVYVVRLNAGTFTLSNRMILVK